MIPGLSTLKATVQHVLKSYTNGQKEHLAMLNIAPRECGWYNRPNPTGLEDVSLDERELEEGVPGQKTTNKAKAALRNYI